VSFALHTELLQMYTMEPPSVRRTMLLEQDLPDLSLLPEHMLPLRARSSTYGEFVLMLMSVDVLASTP
jgi:hypothetical protein